MTMESTLIAVRPPTIRSAQTNDPLLLRGVDGRSVAARRYRDVVIALANDLGGQDRLSKSSKLQIRAAASMTVSIEELQARLVNGEDIDLEQLSRLQNALSRTLASLDRRKKAHPKPEAGPAASLRDRLAAKYPPRAVAEGGSQ